MSANRAALRRAARAGADRSDPLHRSLEQLRRNAMGDPNPTQGTMSLHVWDTVGLTEPDRPTRVMLTLDVGTHASGWWRNSDYDRCLHLSISHPVVLAGHVLRLEAATLDEVRAWARAAFPDHYRMTWTEPPASLFDQDVLLDRRRPGVWHVRLFLDRQNRPIQPEGEVYNLKPWAEGDSPEKVFR